MDAERIQQLREIVGMSREMLAEAQGNNWDQVAELEAGRRGLVKECFQPVTSHQDVPGVAATIREVLHLNQKITELAKAHQETLGTDIHNNKMGRTARAAYLGCR